MTTPHALEHTLETIRHLARPATRLQQVYCNRDLDLGEVDAIGFDMDYTLAIYKQEAMNQLTIELTLPKLVDFCGHPRRILELDYPEQFAIRGLLLDMDTGNILKIDNHRRIHKAYHGFTPLNQADMEQYLRAPIRLNHERYALLDTLYGLPEATIFATLVDDYERHGGAPDGGWRRLYKDVRHCVDLAHSDGRLEAAILSNLDEFVLPAPELFDTLNAFHASGKQLFVITNSYPKYTWHILNHLFPEPDQSWRALFDVVITASKKPGFFDGDAPFYEVDERTFAPHRIARERFLPGKLYQGGNLADFLRMTQIPVERTLYIGDHIYGDILRSRKASTWRVAMIVREMEEEMQQWELLRYELSELDTLEGEIERITQSLTFERWLERRLPTLIETLPQPHPDNLHEQLVLELERAREQLKQRHALMLETVMREQQRLEQHFNPFWGLIFKAGNKNSIFGEQVEDYACLYTSKVENFAHYSPQHYFRAPQQPMPHEMY